MKSRKQTKNQKKTQSRKQAALQVKLTTLDVERKKQARPVIRLRQFFSLRTAMIYLSMLYLELVFRALSHDRFISPGLLYIVLFTVPAAMLVDFLCSLFGPRGGRRAVIIIFALLAIACGAQIVYKDMFGTYFIFFSVVKGGQAFTNFFGMILALVAKNLPSLLLALVPVGFWAGYGIKRVSFRRPRRRIGILRVAVTALVFMLCVFSLRIYGIDEFSPYDLFFRSADVIASVDSLGLGLTMELDIVRTLTGFEPVYGGQIETGPPPTVEYATTAPPVTTAPATEPVTTAATQAPTTEPPFQPQPNVMDIDFEALMATEIDDTLREMHEYFSLQQPTMTNEKTGMFEGSNIIFIVAEGFSHMVLDPDLTPTLYKMATEGFEFTNFYNPVWSVSTSDGEYVASQGLIPKSGVWSFYRSHDNWLPLQLGRQMPKLGYSAYGYHNHSHTYYDRNLSHPNLGYNFKAVGMGLEMTPSWPESDYEMIDITTGDYINDPPFHAYYMTVSGHLEYNFTGNNMAYRNREVVADLDYSEAVRAYLACNYELEKAMTLLLERLEEAGQLENTVIVISADHYPYGLEHEEIEELSGHPVDTEFELHRSALIIYKPGTPHEVIDRPCSSLDILPTVSNLMGLEFDSRLLMGRDIFSDVEPLVIFSNRSFITKDARYSTTSKELIPNEGVELPEGYRKYWSNVINQKFTYSARILDYDYYRVLWPEEAETREAQDAWRNADSGGED